MHKTILVLIDGLGDDTRVQRGHTQQAAEECTPLQAARTPTMDRLATHGLCGLLDSVGGGLACGSDTAHLSLLGYDPLLVYRGRGAFEAMGAGLDMRAGDVAFKCNFAWMHTQEEATGAGRRASGVVERRRCDRNFATWGLPLIAALDGLRLPSFPDVQVAVQHATEHRCGVRIRGAGLTDRVSGTDPLVDGKPLRVSRAKDASAEAERTAAVVNELSQRIFDILSAHPLNVSRAAQGLPTSNIVLLRGAGARLSVQPFDERHGVRGVMVAPTAIIAGIGETLGMQVEKVAGATGDYHTNLIAKAQHLVATMTAHASSAAASAAHSSQHAQHGSAGYDFGFLHVKAVDDAGHDRDAARKIHFLERCDAMLAELLRLLQPTAASIAWTIVLTGDHSTPLRYGDHSTEPVPFLCTALQHLPECAHLRYTPPLAAALGSPRGHALRQLCVEWNPVRRFDELDASLGVLGRFPGRELMPFLKRFREQLCGAEQELKIKNRL